MSAALRERWRAFWFAPAAADDLGIARVVFFGLLAVVYAPNDFRPWAEVAPVFWMPTWSFAVLHLPRVGATTLGAMQVAWKISLVTACLGVATRVSIATATLLGFYLLGLPHCFGKIHHYDAILIFIFAILAVSRCGDAWSLDRWRARTAAPAPSGEYTWPIRAVWVLLALVFFGAGMSKLRTSGLAWISSDSLAIFLVQHQYHLGNAVPLTSFGLVLARHAWLCRALAAVTIVCEAGYPLALLDRRARALFVPGALFMQIGIRVFLGPTFPQMMICNAFWVPWTRLVRRVRRDEAAAQAG